MLTVNKQWKAATIIKKGMAVSIVLTILVALSGCVLMPKEEEVLAPPLKEPPKVAYSYIQLKKGTIERKVECAGYLISVSQVNLSFKNQTGRLKAIHVKEGDKVKKGTIIAELITDNLENQIKQQEILCEKMKTAYETVKSNGKKDLELLELQLYNSRKHLSNMESIDGVYSKEQTDEAGTRVKELEIQYQKAQVSYQSSLKSAEADVELNSLQLDSLKQNYANSRLVSPIDGTIDYIIDADEGEYIDIYQTVVRVADPKDLQVQYSEEKVSDFQLGVKVSVKFNDESVNGTVVATPMDMPQDANENTKKSIRIKLEKIPAEAEIGEAADITLILERKENILIIPRNYMHYVGARKFVNVLEDDVKKERDVETGIQDALEIEITKGVSEGEKIIGN
jgi:membrane fusion protein, macrolide-specific efflux system